MDIQVLVSAKLIHSHDTEANWNANKPDFVPEQGEFIVYDKDETHPFERYKIGDGSTSLKNLPFANTITDDYKAEIKAYIDETILGGEW